MTGRSAALAWWSAATILVSAFLLFQVQPVISKKILPWFGGSPAVWTTAMLFFQMVLLAGYAYAHWLIRYVPAAKQGLVHALLLIVALVSLPITPGPYWRPDDGAYPALRILLLLLAKVGPTYFLLSATGPLVQAWYSRAYQGQSPYRLYALSNIGSLAALLTYPFVFERTLGVDTQGAFWSLGFVVFAMLIGGLALSMWRLSTPDTVTSAPPAMPLPANQADNAAPPTNWQRAAWIGLAALASSALLAITTHVCQDIAVTPFMWVVPLSLYLLSFIICFDSERWYVRKLWGPLAVLGLLLLSGLKNAAVVDGFLKAPLAETWLAKQFPVVAKFGSPVTFSNLLDAVFVATSWTVARIDKLVQALFQPEWHLEFKFRTVDYSDHLIAQAISYLVVLFLICMVCHGELVKSKPAPRHLTMYFLMISLGGALGGLFVALLCPLIFKAYSELPLVLIGGFAIGWVAIYNDGRHAWLRGSTDLLQWGGAFVVVGTLLLVTKANFDWTDPQRLLALMTGLRDELVKRQIVPPPEENLVAMERNFYGTLSVKDEDDGDGNRRRSLYHGRILHGNQYFDRPHEATTYYVDAAGSGLAAEHFPRSAGRGLRVAVIGLGTGTMAAHGKKGDVYRFYDIDPKVLHISEKYFTFRKDSAAEVQVVLGDARIQLERELAKEGPGDYDIIVLDAFSGDAIPVHLLTAEAVATYCQHLRKDARGQPIGLLAVHVSNLYLDLVPVVAALAKKFDLPARMIHVDELGFDSGETGSDWILLTRNQAFWNDPAVQARLPEPLNSAKPDVLWTDQHSSLLPILN
ncbi:MAG: fused MFS/spermidine synthase [Pirellulaceae bacterium]|nr:fused MFS/spermidine synthase [Pirellulaceae bacterium]